MADPKLDDSSWRRMRIGIFNLPDNADAHHALFRKTFRVPESWDHGRVCLFTHGDVRARWRRYLDGKPLQAANGPDDDLGGLLKPGSSHCLAIEFWGTDLPGGNDRRRSSSPTGPTPRRGSRSRNYGPTPRTGSRMVPQRPCRSRRRARARSALR